MRTVVFVFFILCSSTTYAKTSAIIEERITQIKIRTSTNLSIIEYSRIKVLDEEGYVHAVFREHYNSFRSIKSLHYTIYDTSGNKVKKLGKSDAIDVMMNPSYEVADSRVIYLDPKYRNFPFVIEVEVEIVYNGFIDFPLWMPRYAHNLEVSKASLVVSCPKDYMFRTMSYGGVRDPIESILPGLREVRWEIENLPSVPLHQSYRRFVSEQPRVHLAPYQFELDRKAGSFKTWQDFGDWYLHLNNSENILSDDTKKELQYIRDASLDQREIAEKVYQYMQGKTRYVSIQLGIGGYKALPVSEVEKTGYGDCKALSSYTRALLNYLNIPSNYVLVNAGSDAVDVMADFPSNQFNHVFLAIPLKSDTVWLECTSQTAAPSYLGSFTDDRNALWVEIGKSKIIRTPGFDSRQNLRVTKGHATLGVDGTIKLLLNTRQSGVYFEEGSAYKSMNKGQTENYNNKKFSYNDFSIKSFSFSEKKEEQVVDLNFMVDVNNVAKVLGNKIVIPTNILNAFEDHINIDFLNKMGTVRRGFMLEENVLIEVPENFYALHLPDLAKEFNEFGEIEVFVAMEGDNSVRIRRKILIHKGEYKDETWDRFNGFLKRIRAFEQAKIVIQNKT